MCRWITGLVLLTLGCRYGPADFPTRTRADVGHVVETSPPAAPTPEGEALHQVLYQDEYGPAGRDAGQRARMLTWLVSMELDAPQLAGLSKLCGAVAEIRAEEEADQQSVGHFEAEQLGPIHSEIITQLATGVLPEPAAAKDLAARLEAAQILIHGERLPLRRQQKRTSRVLGEIMVWIKMLHPAQLGTISSARFFLRRRAGPLVNPGHYGWVVGSVWDMGDFNLMRFAGDPKKGGGMDLAGLWLLEDQRIKRDSRLSLLQAAAITALAVTEPGLPEAIAVLQGTREPLDFTGPEG